MVFVSDALAVAPRQREYTRTPVCAPHAQPDRPRRTWSSDQILIYWTASRVDRHTTAGVTAGLPQIFPKLGLFVDFYVLTMLSTYNS